MPFADEQIPQISELELGTSAASLYGSWPGSILDALRKAGSVGMVWKDILECLGDEVGMNHPDRSAARNAVDYLVDVGLARCVEIRYYGLRWYVIPLHPHGKEPSE